MFFNQYSLTKALGLLENDDSLDKGLNKEFQDLRAEDHHSAKEDLIALREVCVLLDETIAVTLTLDPNPNSNR